MALIALSQVFYPLVKRSWILLGKSRDWPSHQATLDAIAPSCATVHTDVLNGCSDMKLHGRTIYATCLGKGSTGKHRRWYSPQTVMVDERVQKGRDELIAWDLDSDRITVLDLQNFPATEQRTFHGLDILEVSPSSLSIYVINHLPTTSTIVKFTHKPHTHSAKFVKTFSNPTMVPNPHSVFAVPGEDVNNAFFVTSDRKHRAGWQRALETFVRLSSTRVAYHSDVVGWRTSTNALAGTGALVGPKGGDSRRLYVAEILGGSVDVFDRVVAGGELTAAEARSAEGNLTWVQRIELNFVPSGLALSHPDGDDLYISGLPKPLDFLTHHGEGISIPYLDGISIPYLGNLGHLGVGSGKQSAASLVARINTKELGSSFFGGKGSDETNDKGGSKSKNTANPSVDEFLVDEHGRLVNGSTTVVYDRAQPGRKGNLYVSGLSSKGVLKCKQLDM
ncbi:MAG: Serum paraoxonase/arylesterase 2 [Caeruleum heppii]|nr:MAG: Serum paraoxonase/arylesterase 2 [Caeruleum heppii]